MSSVPQTHRLERHFIEIDERIVVLGSDQLPRLCVGIHARHRPGKGTLRRFPQEVDSDRPDQGGRHEVVRGGHVVVADLDEALDDERRGSAEDRNRKVVRDPHTAVAARRRELSGQRRSEVGDVERDREAIRAKPAKVDQTAPTEIRRNAGTENSTVLPAPIQSTGRRPIRSESFPVSGMHRAITTSTGIVSKVPCTGS